MIRREVKRARLRPIYVYGFFATMLAAHLYVSVARLVDIGDRRDREGIRAAKHIKLMREMDESIARADAAIRQNNVWLSNSLNLTTTGTNDLTYTFAIGDTHAISGYLTAP